MLEFDKKIADLVPEASELLAERQEKAEQQNQRCIKLLAEQIITAIKDGKQIVNYTFDGHFDTSAIKDRLMQIFKSKGWALEITTSSGGIRKMDFNNGTYKTDFNIMISQIK